MDKFYGTDTRNLVILDDTARRLLWGEGAPTLDIEHIKEVTTEMLNERRIPKAPLDLQLDFLAQYYASRHLYTLQTYIQQQQQLIADTLLPQSQEAGQDIAKDVAGIVKQLNTTTTKLGKLREGREGLHKQQHELMMKYDKELKDFNQKWVKKIADALNKAGISFMAEHQEALLTSLNNESPEALARRAGSLKITDKKGAKEKALFGKKTIPEKDTIQYRVLSTIVEKSTITQGVKDIQNLQKELKSLLQEYNKEASKLVSDYTEQSSGLIKEASIIADESLASETQNKKVTTRAIEKIKERIKKRSEVTRAKKEGPPKPSA